jgi:hypothetical protein
MHLRRICCLLLLVALVLAAKTFIYAEAPLPETADAYHFKFWQGSPYNAAYTEWWYFNLYDAKDDLQAIFTYQVLDPLNLTSFGASQIAALVYQGNKIVADAGFYPRLCSQLRTRLRTSASAQTRSLSLGRIHMS